MADDSPALERDVDARFREFSQTAASFLQRALQTKEPAIDPALLERDWQAELPFLDWTADGGLVWGVTANGEAGYQCTDGSCIAFDDPRLGQYREVANYRFQKQLAQIARKADEFHDYVSDPTNHEPIPRRILRARPTLAAWLNGENPRYSPSVAEWMIVLPAFIERRRRIREQQLRQPNPVASAGAAIDELMAQLKGAVIVNVLPPLDGLAPIEAMRILAPYMAEELGVWRNLTRLPKETDADQRGILQKNIQGLVERFNVAWPAYLANVDAALPQLRRVHAPNVVSFGGESATCFAELVGSLFRKLRIYCDIGARTVAERDDADLLNANLVVENWTTVSGLAEPLFSNFDLGRLRAQLQQEFFAADDANSVERFHPKNSASHKRPLTDEQQKAFEYIKADGPVMGKQICSALGISSESTFTTHYVPALKAHGVLNRRGAGYYLPEQH